MKHRIVLALAFLIFHAAAAQKLVATVDRQQILIGEQIQLRLQANFFPGEPLSWFDIDTIPRFEILSKSDVDTIRQADGTALSQQLLLTSWDSGKIQLPPFVLGSAQTKAIPINVAYAPSPFDTAQPYHDIKDILEVKRPPAQTWYWYVIFALVLIALFLLFFPKGKKKAPGSFVPDEGAYKKALKGLDKLEQSAPADHKLFYTELVHIFREYLHRRRNIHSFSKTTDDLAVQMQKLNIDREDYAALLQTLRLSDLVKFARFTPSKQEEESSVATIRQSIINIENLPHAV